MSAYIRIVVAAFAAVLLANTATALADDEGSEHSAQLVGAEADTLGLQVNFAGAGQSPAMWSMDFRARPGAPTQHIELPFLPTTHGHFHVLVSTARRTVTFVLTSAGALTLDTEVAWILDRTGTLRATLQLKHFIDNEGLAALRRSISHVNWLTTAPAMTPTGIELRTAHNRYVLDPIARKLRAGR